MTLLVYFRPLSAFRRSPLFMSIIQPRRMPPKPERKPAHGTAEWYTMKREQANARKARRERKYPREPHGQPDEQEKRRHGALRSGNSRLKPFSTEPKKVERQGHYVSVKAEWREECIARDGYHRCEWHDGAGNRCKRRASKHPHHKAGRDGELLYDKRFFMSICEGATGHHRRIHTEVKESEERGFIIRIRTKR